MTRYGQTMAEALQGINEKLKPSDGAGAYVKDFRKSDAPQFKGKSDKQLQKMAVAAYLDDKEENMKLGDNESVNEKMMKGFVVRYTDKNGERLAVPYKTRDRAKEEVKALKKLGAKDIEITTHNLNFKEDEVNEVAPVAMALGKTAARAAGAAAGTAVANKVMGKEGFASDAQRKAAFAQGYKAKGKDKKEAVSPEQQAAIAISKKEKEKDDAILVDKKVKEEKTKFEAYTGVPNPRTEGRKSNYATDDEDEEGANKNIIMQLYKAISLRGRFDVVFDDGKKQKVKEPIAIRAVELHRQIQKPRERLAFQNKISKSYRDLLNAIR